MNRTRFRPSVTDLEPRRCLDAGAPVPVAPPPGIVFPPDAGPRPAVLMPSDADLIVAPMTPTTPSYRYSDTLWLIFTGGAGPNQMPPPGYPLMPSLPTLTMPLVLPAAPDTHFFIDDHPPNPPYLIPATMPVFMGPPAYLDEGIPFVAPLAPSPMPTDPPIMP